MFLVALCLSIFLEAISRFWEPQQVSNPKLVLIVGCLGLASNILGLVLFHEHSHNHGGHQGHSHAGNVKISDAEEGQNPEGSDVQTEIVGDERGNVEDVLPETILASLQKSTKRVEVSNGSSNDEPKAFSKGHEEEPTAVNTPSPLSARKLSGSSVWLQGRRTSGSRSRFANEDDIRVHPASFRNEIIASSKLKSIESAASSDSESDGDSQPGSLSESSPLLAKAKSNGPSKNANQPAAPHPLSTGEDSHPGHEGHKHTQGKKEHQSGHKHSDLNMRGIFLHVLGDALGNLGVIGSALIIWRTDYSWRFYSDPAISLVITIIILCSALPLCRAASRILLQAAPEHISVKDIKDDIETVSGVSSCHQLHVWQLSDNNLVASLHIELDYDFKGEGSARYMRLAQGIRECLHGYGIHHSTIQPEFCLDKSRRRAMRSTTEDGDSDTNKASSSGVDITRISKNASRTTSPRSERNVCLLKCGDECDGRGQYGVPGREGEDEAGHPG